MRTYFSFAAFLFFSSELLTADPTWWETRGVKSTAPAANLAPATVGQAKHMAAMALAELEEILPTPAFQALQTDLSTIVDLSLPEPLPPDFQEQQRAILLTGQLKALAKPFYDHLRTRDAAWLDNAMSAGNLVVMEPGSNPPVPSPYPWSEAATDDANRAPATLGQLKAVFSLPLETLIDTTTDTDSDGIPDYWETRYGLDPNDHADVYADADADRIPNLWEYLHKTNPNDSASKPVVSATVAADGSGNYLTLQEAQYAVQDAAIIEVSPGTYDGYGSWDGKGILWLAQANIAAHPVTITNPWAYSAVETSGHTGFDGFTFRNNTQAVSVSSGTAGFINCLFVGSSMEWGTSALYAASGTKISLIHCTFFGNIDQSGVANTIHAELGTHLIIHNSILWNPVSNGVPEIESAGTISVAHSIIRGGQHGGLTTPPSLAHKGWMTFPSPARNAGAPGWSARDIHGELRPTSSAPDLGCDQFHDSDSDGLPDWLEAHGITDPAADHDSDGLTNLGEYQTHGTNLMAADTDDDGLTDGQEILIYNTDPSNPDTDGDDMPDAWEVQNGLNPNSLLDILYDLDDDGLINLEEYQYGSNPFIADSDGDGMPDGWEVMHGFNPTHAADANEDADGDSFTNLQEYELGTDPNNPDSDGDGTWDGDENDGGTDPNDPNDTPESGWLILTGDLGEGVPKNLKRTVTIPAGQSRVIVVLIASEEYPNFTGDESEFNDTLSWDIHPGSLNPLQGSIDVNARHGQWETAETEERTFRTFDPVHIESGMTVTAPDDATLEVEIDLTATNVGDGALPSTVMVGLLPIVPVEFFPLVLDDDGQEVPNSGAPRLEEGQTNVMVEHNPVANRIAHREMKMKIVDGEILKWKTITWSMDPLFVHPNAEEPVFRGNWVISLNSNNTYFRTSDHYETLDFEAGSEAPTPTTATTTLDENGESAIRINLPPIGFNKGRVKIQVEDFSGDAAKVADMEVPAVIVIDPGHGGTANVEGSNANNATSPTGVLEKTMTLDYARELRNSINEYSEENGALINVLMTRDAEVNPTGVERASIARDRGADIFHSFHFNATNGRARGTETLIRGVANVNEDEDRAFGQRVLDGILAGIRQYDEDGAADRGVKNYAWSESQQQNVPSVWAVLSDTTYSNIISYHPIRGIIAEVEFIDVPAVDQLLNTGVNAIAIRKAIADQIRDAIIENINNQTQ